MKFLVGVIAQAGEVVAVWSEAAESKMDVWKKMITDGITHLPDDESLVKAYETIRAIEEPDDDQIHTFIAAIEDAEDYDISIWDLTDDVEEYNLEESGEDSPA